MLVVLEVETHTCVATHPTATSSLLLGRNSQEDGNSSLEGAILTLKSLPCGKSSRAKRNMRRVVCSSCYS